jgi:hypothetical protein
MPGGVTSSGKETPTPTPGLPAFYFALGTGLSLPLAGFGTEGNPWVDTGTATLANGVGTSFSPSVAFDIVAGFNFDKYLSANLSLENYAFSTAQDSASNETNIIPSLRYTLTSDQISPYFTAGFGFNFNATSAVVPASILLINPSAQSGYNTQSASNWVASGGVGLLINITGAGHFFAQVLYQQVLTTQGGFAYSPITLGFQYP